MCVIRFVETRAYLGSWVLGYADSHPRFDSRLKRDNLSCGWRGDRLYYGLGLWGNPISAEIIVLMYVWKIIQRYSHKIFPDFKHRFIFISINTQIVDNTRGKKSYYMKFKGNLKTKYIFMKCQTFSKNKNVFIYFNINKIIIWKCTKAIVLFKLKRNTCAALGHLSVI